MRRNQERKYGSGLMTKHVIPTINDHLMSQVKRFIKGDLEFGGAFEPVGKSQYGSGFNKSIKYGGAFEPVGKMRYGKGSILNGNSAVKKTLLAELLMR